MSFWDDVGDFFTGKMDWQEEAAHALGFEDAGWGASDAGKQVLFGLGLGALGGGLLGGGQPAVSAAGAAAASGATAGSTGGTMTLLDNIAKIAGIATPFISSAMQIYGQDQTNKQQIGLSNKQMAFQEAMSNTIYQRGTKDLIAAGLNPVLAAGNINTNAPTGAMPSLVNPFKDVGELGIKGTANASQIALNKELIKTQASTQLLNSALAAKADMEKKRTLADTVFQWLENEKEYQKGAVSRSAVGKIIGALQDFSPLYNIISLGK